MPYGEVLAARDALRLGTVTRSATESVESRPVSVPTASGEATQVPIRCRSRADFMDADGVLEMTEGLGFEGQGRR